MAYSLLHRALHLVSQSCSSITLSLFWHITLTLVLQEYWSTKCYTPEPPPEIWPLTDRPMLLFAAIPDAPRASVLAKDRQEVLLIAFEATTEAFMKRCEVAAKSPAAGVGSPHRATIRAYSDQAQSPHQTNIM